MSGFSNPAADPSMLTYLAMAGGGQAANSVSNYVQNFERRKAIRGSLYAPSMGRAPHPSNGSGPMAGMSNPGAGYGIDQNQVDAANNALSPFGLQTPSHINPFLFFHDQDADGNPTWAGNHPKVAGVLEGAMLGAQTPPSNTSGEAISNIARTVMGIPSLYRQNASAQMNTPFQTAGEIQSLQKGQAQIERDNAETDQANAHAEYFRNSDQREKHQRPMVNPVTGETLSEDPDNPGHWLKDPALQEKPKPATGRMPGTSHYTEQDYIDRVNQERQANGQSPLDSQGELDAVHKFAGQKAIPRKPYVDPNLSFQVTQAQKDIENYQNEYSKTGGMPSDPIQAQILQHTDPERWARIQQAQTNLQGAITHKQNLMDQHYTYSQQAQTQTDQTPDSSDLAQPVAPVRVPGVSNVQTNNGQQGALVPGPLVNGRPSLQIAPQPGTTRPQSTAPTKAPQQLDDNTARQILQEAGGDKDKARAIAKQRNLKF